MNRLVYADTSFLMSYFIDDAHTEKTRAEVLGISGPIRISPLGHLEFHNSVWRKVGMDGFEKNHAERAIRQFDEQIEEGWFEMSGLKKQVVWKRALTLATIYSTELKVRTLDILHVSEAVELSATCFWGFDDRQNTLAQRAGLGLMGNIGNP